MSAQILSLCSGYGGLDIAVEQFYGAQTAYYCEIEPACLEVLAGRFPTALKSGSLEELKTSTIEADIITAGYPCQPFSLAGKRKGENDERHLWPVIGAIISNVRPARVILENVSGHLTSGGTAVIADLTRMGYSCKWGTIRASDAGAPHRRARWFCVATDTKSSTEHSESEASQGMARKFGGSASRAFTNTESRYVQRQRKPGELAGTTRPTEQLRWNASTDSGKEFTDTESSERTNSEYENMGTAIRSASEFRECFSASSWGQYEQAVRRWQQLLGRVAPIPVEEGKLSALFVEWMMGLPEGWVTDIVDHRGKALKMLGNGVVPQQAALALEHLG